MLLTDSCYVLLCPAVLRCGQLLRYTCWGGVMVDASTAANHGFSPLEWARGTTDSRNSERDAMLFDARMSEYVLPQPHGYR